MLFCLVLLGTPARKAARQNQSNRLRRVMRPVGCALILVGGAISCSPAWCRLVGAPNPRVDVRTPPLRHAETSKQSRRCAAPSLPSSRLSPLPRPPPSPSGASGMALATLRLSAEFHMSCRPKEFKADIVDFDLQSNHTQNYTQAYSYRFV